MWGGLSRPHYFDWMHSIYMHQDGLSTHRNEGGKSEHLLSLNTYTEHQHLLLSFYRGSGNAEVKCRGAPAPQGMYECSCIMFVCMCVSPPPAPLAAEPAGVPGTVHGGKVSCVPSGGKDPRAGDQAGV